jgi:hypothetical protein
MLPGGGLELTRRVLILGFAWCGSCLGLDCSARPVLLCMEARRVAVIAAPQAEALPSGAAGTGETLGD